MIGAEGGDEKVLLLNTSPKYGIRWLDDGQKLTFAMTENDETNIYTTRPNGSELTKVITLPSQFTSFSWSPDEQYITYMPKKDGIVSAFLANVDTKEVSQISDHILGISWSADGKQLVYVQVSATKQNIMHIVDIKGKDIYSFIANNMYNDSVPLWIE